MEFSFHFNADSNDLYALTEIIDFQGGYSEY